MCIVVDKIAHHIPYEGFPVCPTIPVPLGTYILQIL